MTTQEIYAAADLVRVRELKAALSRAAEENHRLHDENEMLRVHFALAVRVADDFARLGATGRLRIVDGWNRVLGAHRTARSPEELLRQARDYLAAHPEDLVWVVFDGPRESVRVEGRLRVSYTGGTGPHRADRFICDVLRAARFGGALDRIDVDTDDRDFRREVARLTGKR